MSDSNDVGTLVVDSSVASAIVPLPAAPRNLYNVKDWYWTIENIPGMVYSSARATLVPANDADYITWQEINPDTGKPLRKPTRIDTMQSLMQVLLQQYPQGTPIGQLLALMEGNLWVECTSNTDLNGVYSIASDRRSNITGIATSINAGLGLPGGGATFNYPDATGVPHPWPADKFIAFAKVVMDYVYALSQNAGGNPVPLPDQPIVIP